jgi:hypothetical protein
MAEVADPALAELPVVPVPPSVLLPLSAVLPVPGLVMVPPAVPAVPPLPSVVPLAPEFPNAELPFAVEPELPMLLPGVDVPAMVVPLLVELPVDPATPAEVPSGLGHGMVGAVPGTVCALARPAAPASVELAMSMTIRAVHVFMGQASFQEHG